MVVINVDIIVSASYLSHEYYQVVSLPWIPLFIRGGNIEIVIEVTCCVYPAATGMLLVAACGEMMTGALHVNKTVFATGWVSAFPFLLYLTTGALLL